MAKFLKNRVTFKFDEDHKFIIYLATLEQVNAFTHYFRRCIKIPFTSYTQEVLKGDSWMTTYEGGRSSFDENMANNRAKTAPFKLNVQICENRNSLQFNFEMYFFSSLDIDYITMLLENGTSSDQLILTSENRNHETGEWQSREQGKLAPKSLVELYNTLNTNSKEEAMAAMFKLKQLQVNS